MSTVTLTGDDYRYGFTPPIFLVNQQLSDDFAFLLIAATLLCATFPLLHHIAKPNPKAIKPFDSRRVKRRRSKSTRKG